MHRIIIHNLGPVVSCELECSQFMTLTGFQASGKSTIAKTIYYFRTIKEDIVQLVQRQAFDSVQAVVFEEEEGDYGIGYRMDLVTGLERFLCQKFRMVFGTMGGMSKEMRVEYYFTSECYLSVFLAKNAKRHLSDRICVRFSDTLATFLRNKNRSFPVAPTGISEHEMRILKIELCQLFDDFCSTVYIPAGRSMLTLLSQQFGYIYATMDNFQKRSMDLCTRDYLERILRVKAEFSDGLVGLLEYFSERNTVSSEIVEQALKLISKILRGDYRCRNGEEQIVLDNGNVIKINFSSSGQQECVWILNLLFYYLLQKKRMLFIIEEPESHLFPASQKYMTELIALVMNCNHSVVLTTHSPYVLGTLNNLLYAHIVSVNEHKHTCEIIHNSFWLDYHRFYAWFVKEGTIDNCMDNEIHMIMNEKIDEISKVINDDFDRLLELHNPDQEGGMPTCL